MTPRVVCCPSSSRLTGQHLTAVDLDGLDRSTKLLRQYAVAGVVWADDELFVTYCPVTSGVFLVDCSFAVVAGRGDLPFSWVIMSPLFFK